MRGRLINPFLLELRRLDTDAIANAGGFNDVFREPRPSAPNADGRVDARQEDDPILIPVQVEPNTYEKMMMEGGGDDPDAKIVFVMHFQDLEELGLVDANGQPAIRLGDRATAIYRYEDEALIMKLGLQGEGFYATELQPQSFGLSGGERNLLLATFERRERSFRG